MLQYTRRTETISRLDYSSIKSTSELDNDPILTYCNWNYKKNRHLSTNKLVSIITRFDEKKLPYYVRIFNEIPVTTTQHFLDNNNLSDSDLKTIWSETSKVRGVRLQKDFWEKYNLSRAS